MRQHLFSALVVGAIALGISVSDAQGQCRGGMGGMSGMGGSLAGTSMMMPQGGMMNPLNSQTAYLQQQQLAYQYQMQRAYLESELQLQKANIEKQQALAAQKAQYREQRLAERRERKLADKARRESLKSSSTAKSSKAAPNALSRSDNVLR